MKEEVDLPLKMRANEEGAFAKVGGEDLGDGCDFHGKQIGNEGAQFSGKF